MKNKEFQVYLSMFEERVPQTVDTIVKALKKSGAKGFVVGMSGGLDCAVAAALCVRANIPCLAITMPYEAESSPQRLKGIEHAQLVSDRLGIELRMIDITTEVNQIITKGNAILSDQKVLGDTEMSKANVLPRVRMTNLYYAAQCLDYFVLGTGNLSEITMGYFTKWGDGASDVNPLKNFMKSEVFILAKYLNIPEEVINKKPSADLWDEQTDENEMGLTYDDIDSWIVFKIAEEKTVKLIESAIRKNAHKMKFDLTKCKSWLSAV